MASKKKVYAVARGKVTGIYTEWFGPNGAEIQIRGVPGARYKGFLSLEEANAWLEDPQTLSGLKSSGSKSSGLKSAKRTEPKQKTDKPVDIVIYTDGACTNNPGPGGYGVVIHKNGKRKEMSGGYRYTTNNRMELLACIKGLEQVKKKSTVMLYSDSKYVVDGMTKGWAKKWKSRGWIKSNNEPALNPDLWSRLLDLCDQHEVMFVWVKGHAGNPENERCDRLATSEAAGKNLPEDKGYKK